MMFQQMTRSLARNNKSVFSLFVMLHSESSYYLSLKTAIKCLNRMFPTLPTHFPFRNRKDPLIYFDPTEKIIKSDLLKLRTAVDPRTTLTPGVDLLSV